MLRILAILAMLIGLGCSGQQVPGPSDPIYRPIEWNFPNGDRCYVIAYGEKYGQAISCVR